MIDVRTLNDFYDLNQNVCITCIDGQQITGNIASVDDEEESGLGEIGCTVFTPDGSCVGVGISEIKTINAV